MRLDEEQIKHLANLARLNVGEDEIHKFSAQISDILEYFGQLGEIDTDKVEPMSHALPIANVTREDKVKQIFSQDRVLAEAPELEKRQIKVKAVFDKN